MSWPTAFKYVSFFESVEMAVPRCLIYRDNGGRRLKLSIKVMAFPRRFRCCLLRLHHCDCSMQRLRGAVSVPSLRPSILNLILTRGYFSPSRPKASSKTFKTLSITLVYVTHFSFVRLCLFFMPQYLWSKLQSFVIRPISANCSTFYQAMAAKWPKESGAFKSTWL